MELSTIIKKKDIKLIFINICSIVLLLMINRRQKKLLLTAISTPPPRILELCYITSIAANNWVLHVKAKFGIIKIINYQVADKMIMLEIKTLRLNNKFNFVFNPKRSKSIKIDILILSISKSFFEITGNFLISITNKFVSSAFFFN